MDKPENTLPVRTIAALATPAAPAGLGVIRLSGQDAPAIAGRVFRPARKGSSLPDAPGYTALYGHVFDAEGDIDDCVALVFRAPHSYTGENVVELSCHGGLYLLQRTLRALLDAGASPAGPGEFTRRAFVNGKMDLTRAEAVMDLIAANGRLAAKTALAAREGALYRRMEGVRRNLLGAAANLAAFVDYPDDDISALHPDTLDATLAGAEEALSALLSRFDTGRMLREGVDTAIVGRPNVGKSTLMNCLSGFERSIVTPVAGTTRDVVEETVRVGEITLRLADTAGQRATNDEVESIGVERARRRMETAALVLAVFDGSAPLTADDRALAKECAGQSAIAVVNKGDLPDGMPSNDKEYIESLYIHTVYIAAKTGEGMAALERAILDVTGMAALDEAEPVLATERQRNCVRRAWDAVREAREALACGMTLDAVNVSLDGAIEALSELTGEKATEAVVREVFARFCVGK